MLLRRNKLHILITTNTFQKAWPTLAPSPITTNRKIGVLFNSAPDFVAWLCRCVCAGKDNQKHTLESTNVYAVHIDTYSVPYIQWSRRSWANAFTLTNLFWQQDLLQTPPQHDPNLAHHNLTSLNCLTVTKPRPCVHRSLCTIIF